MWSFPGGSVVKSPPAKAEDMGLIPGSGRSPGEENGNPLQYSCLGNPMDREAWWTTAHGPARVRHDLATEQQLWNMNPFPSNRSESLPVNEVNSFKNTITCPIA